MPKIGLKNIFRNYSKDFALNTIASLLSTGAMQLVVLPQLAKNLSINDYGVMLTATGYMNVITMSFGNNLCNARLLMQKKYNEERTIGDFQILLIGASIGSVVCALLCNIFLKQGLWIILPFALISLTGIWRTYYLVTYRISINYTKNLIANVFSCIGYCIGGLLLVKFVSWPWVFLPANILTVVYIYFSSNIIKEPIRKTSHFNEATMISFTLFISGLIGNITTYLDRFIIYPVLGSESVSVYATAAWFSKSVLIVMAPITSVLLSYLMAGKLILTKKKFDRLGMILVFGTVVFWLISIIVAPIITGWLYPTLIEMAKPFVSYASLAVAMGILGNFFATVVLAHAPVKWQTIMSIIKITLYFVLGYVGVKFYGILGMCIAVFATNFVYVTLQFVVARKWVVFKEDEK